jgi:hypothetical protein
MSDDDLHGSILVSLVGHHADDCFCCLLAQFVGVLLLLLLIKQKFLNGEADLDLAFLERLLNV